MPTVAMVDLEQNLGRFMELTEHEPVFVESEQHPAVLISLDDYRRTHNRDNETLLEFFDRTADDVEFEIPPRDQSIGRIPTFDD